MPFRKRVIKPVLRRKSTLLRRDEFASGTGEKAWPTPRERQFYKDSGYHVLRFGVLLYNEHMYIPAQKALRHEIMYLFYNCPSAGHWGVQKTMDLI